METCIACSEVITVLVVKIEEEDGSVSVYCSPCGEIELLGVEQVRKPTPGGVNWVLSKGWV